MDLLAKLLEEEAEKGATSINLSDKKLQVIPVQVFGLKSLNRLGLANNYLTFIQKEFSSLSRLKYVNLKSNLLQEIPSALCQLPHLDMLDVSRNQIIKLPDRPGFLLNLRSLNLSRNNLTKLPLWMGNMKNLELLQVHKNPIEWPPGNIINCPPDEIEEWLVGLKNYLKTFKEKEDKEEKLQEREDQLKNLINILQEALNVKVVNNGNLKILTATYTVLSVMDVFFRTFLGQVRLELGQYELFKTLQASTLKLAYCVIGFEKMDRVKEGIRTVIYDLKVFLNSHNSGLKSRTARFHMFGYFCMSNDLEKGISDLLNPELTKSDVNRISQASEISAQGKSLLFSLSELQEDHGPTILEFEKSLDSLLKTNDLLTFTEALLKLVKEIDPKENKDIVKQAFDLLQLVRCVLYSIS